MKATMLPSPTDGTEPTYTHDEFAALSDDARERYFESLAARYYRELQARHRAVAEDDLEQTIR